MHRFANRSLLFRLRLSALLLILFTLGIVLLPAAVIWGTVFHDPRGILACFILLPTTVVSGLLFLLISSDVRCPLCRGQVLRRSSANTINAKARGLLGSYRLRVVCGIFFTGGFRCLHCGEPCDAVEPRR